MLAPDTILQSRYRVIRLLGQGGMGAVYEAMDERLDTMVALKETLFADDRLRKQFEREARLLARMHHPALPRVSDHFSEGEGQFLVMQFIDGEDLARMMKSKQGPFPPNQVLTWGDQLLDALDYLHTQDPQIIHRDIKPQNLKLTSRGQIILLDFGLAKGQAGGISVVTTSASIYGYTPNYAPLEQIQGLGTDARSDIYALSATLYHLMTGVKPPDALTRAAALVNGQPDPLAPANEISPTIGPEISGVLVRAMSQNREQRYPTAAAMREVLKATSEGATLVGKTEAATVLFEPPEATRLVASPANTKPTALKAGETTVVRHEVHRGDRRWSSWATGVAAVLLVGILFGGFYAYQHRNNSTTTTSPALAAPSVLGGGSPTVPEPTTASTTTTNALAGNAGEEKKTETPIQRAAAKQAAKKTENAAAKNEKAMEKQSTPGSVPTPAKSSEETFAPKNPPAAPNVPEVNTPDQSRMARRRRQMGGVEIRNFPDGSQLIKTPDGTRVFVSPNGTRRILRPGERLERRRNLP